ncbi:MAG: hypothetical protein HeimC2_33640 [Candidatus Heimdallarchaeota archaeon LC_2]|nr:MAG: hypothetical protein HeimC2_33640 [Candidatus Heimdallarchaeota archaeon LC_2]
MSIAIEPCKSNNLLDFFETELDYHQQLILLVFSKQHRIIGKTRLQKLIFLMDNEILGKPIFQYEPYKFGPYSAKLIAAMDELMELGLIKEKFNEYREPEIYVTEYEISAIGLEKANQMIHKINPIKLEKIEEMVHEHGYQEIDSILHHVYVNYPTFTENSIIKDEVFNY